MINMVQFLFAYTFMASCNSIGYVPALVVERALFIRSCWPWPSALVCCMCSTFL